MFANFKRLAFLMLTMVISVAHAGSNEKLAVLFKTTEITAKLLSIVKQDLELNKKEGLRNSHTKIENLISTEKNIDVLVTLALISRSYSLPGRSEDQLIDNAFDEMWRSCVRRIERLGGKNAVDSLESLKETQPIDGAYSLLLQRSIDNLKGKMN